MMIEADAIKRIEELLAGQGDSHTDIPSVILPSGVQVNSLEHLMDAPSRMRQRYKTERIPDFIRYVGDAAVEQNGLSVVYVLPNGSKATAVIDHGSVSDPLWGDHKAVLELAQTRAFTALSNLCGRSLSNQMLIDYLEDWEGVVDAYRHGEKMTAGRAIAAIRRVEIKSTSGSTHEVGDFTASKSAFADIEAKSSAETMPTHLVINEPVYVGTKEQEIVAKIGILPRDDEPSFRIRILRFEAIQEAVADEVESILISSLDEGNVDVFTGELMRPSA